jgi:hypothetical protein
MTKPMTNAQRRFTRLPPLGRGHCAFFRLRSELRRDLNLDRAPAFTSFRRGRAEAPSAGGVAERRRVGHWLLVIGHFPNPRH